MCTRSDLCASLARYLEMCMCVCACAHARMCVCLCVINYYLYKKKILLPFWQRAAGSSSVSLTYFPDLCCYIYVADLRSLNTWTFDKVGQHYLELLTHTHHISVVLYFIPDKADFMKNFPQWFNYICKFRYFWAGLAYFLKIFLIFLV